MVKKKTIRQSQEAAVGEAVRLHVLMLAATGHMLASDYASAKRLAVKAQAVMRNLAKCDKASGPLALQWDQKAISEFVNRCTRLLSA